VGKKRGNGEGSISQRQRDGLWQASITLSDGQRKYFYGKTRQIVARKLAAATRDRDHGLPLVTDERLTVERYLEQWLERMQPPHVRASTYLRYTSLLAHVIRAYGSLRLTHLTTHHLITLYARLQQPKAAGGAGLSASTAHPR
jgi:integrase